VNSVEDVLQPGMKVEVRVIRVDVEERKIGLSFVHADFEENVAIRERGQSAAAEGEAQAELADDEPEMEVADDGPDGDAASEDSAAEAEPAS
jgi:small subunit ribosomal protein S1